MTVNQELYGVVAEFSDHEQLVEAAKLARERGYRCMDAYTPFPVEDLPEALGHKRTPVPLIVLLGGIAGAAGGYFMEWYSMAVDYPLNVGGRPLNSWPAYVPITFELMVLCAAISAIIGMLVLNRLPRLHHPIFNASGFERATTDRFFLCIEVRDLKFDAAGTRTFLEGLGPVRVTEVTE